MYCCVKCFKDPEIKAIIHELNLSGDCDFCGKKNVIVCNINENEDLRDNFEGLLDVYTPACELGDGYPRESLDLLKNILYSQWSIFNLEPDAIYKFLVALFPEKYAERPMLFDEPVGIVESIDQVYMQKNSLLGTFQWNDFVEEIKQKNRFHTSIINKHMLRVFLQASIKNYKAGDVFYRARICTDEAGYDPSQMGAPPAQLAKAGRANSEGMSYLYLANSLETTLHETRVGVHDYVTVGKFKLLIDIEVVNLAGIDKISPFQGVELTIHAVNLSHLKKIEHEIAKPLRRLDSTLDYLPTQYISDYIKSLGFSGIEYKSTLSENGVNLAIFDESLFECTSTEVYDIQSLSYRYNLTD